MTDVNVDSPRPMNRNFVYATMSAGSAVLLVLLTGIVGSRLGQAAWGQFSWALALATIGEALMDLGIHQVTIRSVARDRSSAVPLFRNSIALKALPGAVMLAALSGAAYWSRPEPAVRHACVLLLCSAVLRSYLLTVRGVLQGLERFADDSALVIADRLLLLVVGSAAVLLGAGIVGVAGAFIVARAIAVAGALAIAHRHVGGPIPAFDTALWRDLQRRALPLGAFLIVLNLYSYIDTLILGMLATDLETGLYNSAYRIYEGLTYAPAILSSVLTPRLSALWGVSRAAHRRLVGTGLAAAAALAVMVSALAWWLAPSLLQLVFTETALPAVSALRILGAGLIFVFMIWILHAVAISVFEERLLLYTTLVGSVANIGLNFYLIPKYGRDGAALATVAGEALTMAVLFWGLRHALWPAATERS